MPFTLAHPAVVLPFRASTALPFVVFVIGSMAPDFEYLVRLRPTGSFMHSAPGAIVLAVPVTLLVSWFADRAFLPALRELLNLPSHRSTMRRLLPALAAASIGVATHLAWDSFTHPGGVMVRSFAFLSIGTVSGIPLFKLLQHFSSVFGLAFVAHWLHSETRIMQPQSRRTLHVLLIVTGITCLVFGAANATRATGFRDRVGYFAVGALLGLFTAGIAVTVLTYRRRGAT